MSLAALAGMIEELDVKKIQRPKHALRSDMGPLEELIDSIIEKGLLQPIVVRPAREAFEVVAGNRRLEACRRLGMKTIPCHIIHLEDREAFEASLIENLHHKTLTPIEEATAYKKYVEEHGYGGISDLARRIGKSHSYVSRRIALLNLPSQLQEQIVRRRTTPSIAQEIQSLEEEHKTSITELIARQKVTRNQLREIIKQIGRSHERDSARPQDPWELELKRRRNIHRVLARYITTLRLCMIKLQDALDYLHEDQWVLKEILTQPIRQVHQQLDCLIKLKRRTEDSAISC